MTTKLFISYRSLDSAKVDKLVAQLRTLKDADGNPLYDIWQDKTSIPPGQDWWQAIVEAIEACDVFVFMISQESVQNFNCRAELSYARKRNRPILPLALEGEYAFNVVTGKNDIDYWDNVPADITDGRFQFLFYEGTSYAQQFIGAVERLVSLNWPDFPADFPPDPRDTSDATNDTSLIYDEACDYAYRGEFDAAEKLFQKLTAWNDQIFADVAHEWIVMLREYARMVKLDARQNTQFAVKKLWMEYVGQPSKRFLDGVFDPKRLASTYGSKRFGTEANAISKGNSVVPKTDRSVQLGRLPIGASNKIESTNLPQNRLKSLLDEGVTAARNGNVATARRLLEEVIQRDENNERAWIWLATLVKTRVERRICLEKVLRINPDNETAHQALARLGHGSSVRSNSLERQLNVSAEAIHAIIGDPFEWCYVPAGPFIYGEKRKGIFRLFGDNTIEVPAFAMAKYPITYKQFQAFVDDDGFEDNRWWDGLAIGSRSPGDQVWKIDDHPRENVSWYDSIAFCRWLSSQLGAEFAINQVHAWAVRLPTEFEWEKAARGDQGFIYPWGNKFDSRNCNTIESDREQSSPVTAYPNGSSPYDVLDMSGNVQEWCLSDWEDPKAKAIHENISSDHVRTVRGGSCIVKQVYVRASARNSHNPSSRYADQGFRIMRPI